MSTWDRVNEDSVILRVGDRELAVFESYEVKVSLFEQPAAFTVRCGWSKTAAEMLSLWQAGDKFELFIKVGKNQALSESSVPIQVMCGRIDDVGNSGDEGTEIEIAGRDDMARIADAYVAEDQAFHESSYYQLTRKIMDMFGLQDRALLGSNLANRKAVTGVKQMIELVQPRDSKELLLEQTTGGTRKVVYRTIKARLGERWLEFLKRQYKRVGLFLWCAGDGSFVLTDVNPNQDPVVKIVRRLPNEGGYLTPFETAAGRPAYKFGTVNRHSRATVWGRALAGRVDGRSKCKGEYVDDEMVELGFDKPITIHDDDVKTDKEAEYQARRWISDERREAFLLEYPLSGHSAPSLLGSGRAVYNFDTVVEVEDLETGLDCRYYVTDVTFSGPPRRTRIKLARRGDLVFAEELEVKESAKAGLPRHPLRSL